MIRNIGYMLGVLCGVFLGGILIIAILRLTKKDGSIKCKYDERQQAVRGRRYFDNSVGMVVGIFLGVLVYVGYCIWHEGYFSLNENPKKVLIAFAVIAIMNFIIFAVNLIHGNVIKNGILTFNCINLFCGIMFLIIFGELFIKALCNKRETE